MIRTVRLLTLITLMSAGLSAFGQSKPSGSGTKGPHPAANAGTITIAAAADLAPALEPILAEFKKSQGGNAKVTYGASGTLTTQIEQGAPFDVLLSADMGYPKRLVEKKLADEKTLTAYTRGRLVLFMMATVPEDVTHSGLKSLTNPGVTKIAIANPDHAPYGRAAVAAMKKAGVYDQVQSKLVIAENVAQAAQFVKSGNAQAGIIALSAMHDASMRRRGRVVEVDMNDYPPLDQGAVLLKHGANNPLAVSFVQYLSSQMAQGLFVRYGFMPPTTYKDQGGPAAPKKSETKSDDKKPAKKAATPKK